MLKQFCTCFQTTKNVNVYFYVTTWTKQWCPIYIDTTANKGLQFKKFPSFLPVDFLGATFFLGWLARFYMYNAKLTGNTESICDSLNYNLISQCKNWSPPKISQGAAMFYKEIPITGKQGDNSMVSSDEIKWKWRRHPMLLLLL